MRAGWLVPLLLLVAGCTAPPSGTDAAGGPFLVAHAPPLAAWGQGYAGAGTGAEPTVLAMRAHDAVVVGTFFTTFRSEDLGATWVENGDPLFPMFPFIDGIALAEDDAGGLYAASINGVVVSVARSADEGRTWDVHGRLAAVDRIADRPWVAARGASEVAIVYNTGSGTACARSLDRGATWTLAQLSARTPGIAGNLVFDADGALWYASNRSIHRYDVPCAGQPASIALPQGGAQIFVQVDVDADGAVYAAMPSPDNTQMWLFGARGPGGADQRLLAVSPPELRTNTFGSVTVSPTGEVAVAWYASETQGRPDRDGFNGTWKAAAARVSGFWSDAPDVSSRVVDEGPLYRGPICMAGSHCTQRRDMQDYLMADLDAQGRLYVAYTNASALPPSVHVARWDPAPAP
ncbi:MAG TPA: hypothetical protein VFH78_03595 [Candidatus Thermoplasmatota archaeon]|nr:hypothetical protein [Candidatus Thermoplasmatota archaeon]